jgi:ABC-2 type transport system ATP-binding protein
VARGTPDELKAELEGDTVRLELAEPDGGAAHALERLGLSEVLLEGRTLHARSRDGSAAIPAVLAALDAHGVRATSVTLARPSLDEVYLRHAGRAYVA